MVDVHQHAHHEGEDDDQSSNDYVEDREEGGEHLVGVLEDLFVGHDADGAAFEMGDGPVVELGLFFQVFGKDDADVDGRKVIFSQIVDGGEHEPAAGFGDADDLDVSGREAFFLFGPEEDGADLEVEIAGDGLTDDGFGLAGVGESAFELVAELAVEVVAHVVWLEAEDVEGPLADDAVDLRIGGPADDDAIDGDGGLLADFVEDGLGFAGVTSGGDADHFAGVVVGFANAVGDRVDHRDDARDEHDGEGDDGGEGDRLAGVAEQVGEGGEGAVGPHRVAPWVAYVGTVDPSKLDGCPRGSASARDLSLTLPSPHGEGPEGWGIVEIV